MTKKDTQVNILGTNYTIKFVPKANDKELKVCDGYTDFYTKVIVVNNQEDWIKEEPHRSHDVYINKVIRHEIIHAFLYESGLAHNTNDYDSWAMNEEMVDWLAIQMPKMFDVFKKLDIAF